MLKHYDNTIRDFNMCQMCQYVINYNQMHPATPDFDLY